MTTPEGISASGARRRRDKAAYYAYIERRRARLDELFGELAALDKKRNAILEDARAQWEREMGR